MKKRGVLSLWKVILLTFASLLGVAGVSVLGVYLTGGFNKKYVEPEDIQFSQTLDSGNGYYNVELGQYEVSSDFSLVINSTTEGVTEKDVTLSLKNTKTKEDGYISDGVIRVPQKVSLGTPFTVVLERADNGSFEEWIKGGTSVLTAKSSNILLTTQTVTIAVDVPVGSIDVAVAGTESSTDTLEVVVGSTFTLDTTFSPSASKYLFSDTTREKQIFFANSSAYIHYDWDNECFVADEKSGSSVDSIIVYTFSNSYYQKTILEQYASITSPEDLSSAITSYFNSHPEACVSKTVSVKVLDVDVESVTVANAGTSFSMYVDRYYTITASSTNGDENLGVSIKDSRGVSLNSLMGNVGIKIPKGVSGLSITGGQVVKVVSTNDAVTITKENFDASVDYFNAPAGTEYYILPNTTPTNYGDYLWNFASSEKIETTLAINFFYEDQNGDWTNFFDFDGQESQISLIVEEHDNEEDPAWIDNNTISMTINYDGQGNVLPTSRNLANDLNEINKDNTYRQVRYFLFLDTDDSDSANIDISSIFSCLDGVEYTGLNIQNSILTGTYILYELKNGSVLTAVESFAGKVKVVAATIKSDADNKPYMSSGKYSFVKVSRAKDIRVESTLSIVNLVPEVVIDTDVKANANDGNYYISAINRNTDGTQKTMLSLELTLKQSKDVSTDTEKVITAFNSKDLSIVCLDRNGQETNSYVTWQGLTQESTQSSDVVFKGTLTIEESYFTAGKLTLDKGTYIKLQLKYNDGKETHTTDVSIKDVADRDYFYIYYQQPTSVEFAYQKENDLDKDGDGKIDDIDVTITATNGAVITWGNKSVSSIEALNDLFKYTLTDQFDNEIDLNTGIYGIKLVETPIDHDDDIISLDNSTIKNFVSTQGTKKSSNLVIYVVDKDGNYVKKSNNGNITTDDMQSDTLTFNISSEGISKLQYDKTDDKFSGFENDDYENSSNLSAVAVAKYVTTDDTIQMDSTIKVYTQDSTGQDVEVTDLVFQFDNDFVSSLNEERKVDILKMLEITTDPVMTDTSTATSIDDYKNKTIKSIKILGPFKEDTQIVFSVKDKNEALFNITLTLTLKTDITISPAFNTYYEQYADYLETSGNAISIFSGARYELDQYIKLYSTKYGDNKYSWSATLGILADLTSSQSGVFYADQKCASLEVENGIVYLVISDDVYNFTTLQVTLYFGINSFYAASRTLTFYVNPNILVLQETEDVPYINLGDITNETFASKYSFYKLTSYVDNGTQDVVTLSTETFVGTSAIQYITITNREFRFNEQTMSLGLELGETISQSFNIQTKVGDAIQTIDALIQNKETGVITKCDKDAHLVLNFMAGFGTTGNEENLAQNIFDDTTSIKTVVYNGEIYLLLKPSATYKTKFTIKNATGSLYVGNGGNTLNTRQIADFVSFDGNTLDAETTSTDNSGNKLNIVVSLKAIISKVGDNFVYYNNGNVPTDANGDLSISDMKFNTFDGATDFATIISSGSDYTTLQDANIYQTLKAGESYTIVHSSLSGLTLQDVYGFYFDGNVSGITSDQPSASYELSVVENADGYVSELATIEGDTLKISDLESAYDNAYIVLKLRLYTYQGNYEIVWYYRIKVTPSFTVGVVNYPYSDDGEYLDTNSNYYNGATNQYEIDMSEALVSNNSKHTNSKRFGDVVWVDAGKTTTSAYTVKTVVLNGETISDYSNYFTFSYNGDTLTLNLTDDSAKLTVTFERSLYAGETKLIGSEMRYKFIFNQSATYIHTLKQNNVALTQKNNTYTTSISAGEGEVVFTPDIRISSNGAESKVDDFGFYLDGNANELATAFKTKAYLKSGTTVYSDADCTIEFTTLTEDVMLENNWGEIISSPVSFTLDGTTVYAKETDVSYTYSYLSGNKIYICPQDTISKDMSFEIGVYTDEKVVFKIDLTVTSYFKWTINSETVFTGGKEYSLTDIFSTLKSTTNDTISTIDITLTDSSDTETAKLFSYDQSTLSFAHLTVDTTFKFTATITGTAGTTYSFDFELTVAKSFDTTAERVFDDSSNVTKRYGQVSFDVTVAGIQERLANLMPKPKDSTKILYTFKVNGADEDTISIEPTDVGTDTTVTQELTVYCYFNGNELFSFVVKYRYIVRPNVEITTNYPAPDGENALTAEYIGTTASDETQEFASETQSNFFNSTALFDLATRVVVKDIPEQSIERSLKISVSSITNATVSVLKDGKTANIITSSTEDKTVSENLDVDLKFVLVNSATTGQVVFDIVVNKVTKTYTVVLVAGQVVTISTNAPNYTNNQEAVYAEDLSGYEDKALFEQDRIINYAFNTSVTPGTSYDLRFTNSAGEVETVTIKAEVAGVTANFDAGKSLAGYTYTGTYLSNVLVKDEDIYTSTPKLSGRIVVTYYDGTAIHYTDSGNVTLQLALQTTTETTDQDGNTTTTTTTGDYYNASSIKLTADDLEKAKTYKIAIISNGTTIKTTSIYTVYLTSEFTVSGNADSADNYTTVDINAGAERSLWSFASFGIRNARTDQLYDANTIASSNGSVSLAILGFSDANIADGTEAYKIHTSLTNEAGVDKTTTVVYSTGLSPRAGMDLNGATVSGDSTKNYITISGKVSNGKTVDYNIYAQGANNDGNHVMMKITYTVNIGDTTITIEHNILFKVLPNSTMKFKSQHEETQTYNNASTEIVDGQTVASNSEAPYTITFASGDSDKKKFNFWSTSNETKTLAPVINASMYGQSSNAAKKFSYSYNSALGQQGLNEKTSLIDWTNWNTPEGSTYTPSDTTSAVSATVNVLKLGTTKFMFELENDFGYKARFYVQVVASENPTIESMPSTLKEGESLAVGARFQTVSLVTANGDYAYKSQDYVENTTNVGDKSYANEIKFNYVENTTGETQSYANETAFTDIASARIEATDTSGNTWTRKYNSISDNSIKIFESTQDGDNGGFTAATGDTTLSLKQEQLESFILYVKPTTVEKPTSVSTYTATYIGAKKTINANQQISYGNLTMTQAHSTSSIYTNPNFTGATSDTTTSSETTNNQSSSATYQVVLAGISANGYANTLGAVDGNSILTSRVNSLYVKYIRFYYNNELLGTTYNDGTAKTQTGSGSVSGGKVRLITNADYTFFGDDKVSSAGVSYSTATAFAVPTINGYYFGTSDYLSQVKMVITLTDGGEGNAENTCDLEKYVTIERAQTLDLFTSDVVYDNSAVSKDGVANTYSGTVYNDTLEVVLAPNSSVSFVINDESVTSVTNGVLTDKNKKTKSANIITLKNNRTYTVTEYVGITANIVEINTNKARTFYVYVTDGKATFKYNGSSNGCALSAGDNGVKQWERTIGTLSPIGLKIENVTELGSSDYKTETLYFLYNNGTQPYQKMKTFKVYPIFKYASADGSSASSENVKVESYLTATKGTDTYYLLRLEDWAKDIKLYNQDNKATSLGSYNSSVYNSYKLYFEINASGDGGAGSAFIDETGLITTTTDFKPGTHTITVNVYCRVSGQDGKFEVANTKLKLGSFRLYLTGKAASEGTISGEQGLVATDGTNLYVVPTGYTITGVSSSSTISTSTSTVKSVSIKLGDSIDFADMFGQVSDIADKTNKNYHIVSYTKDKTTTYTNFDNLDSWTFSEAGVYSINVVCSYVENGKINFVSMTADVLVYEATTTEEQQYVLSTTGSVTLSKDYTWYDIANGSMTQTSTYSNAKAGVYEETYIAVDSAGKQKLVNATFYVYGSSKTDTVAIRPQTTFSLANLVELEDGEKVEIYSIDDSGTKVTSKSSISFSLTANQQREGKFVFVIKSGTDTKVEYHEVTFDIIPSDITEVATLIGRSGDMLATAAATIKDYYKANYTSRTISSVKYLSTQGVVLDSVKFTDNVSQQAQTFLVTYKENNAEKYERFRVTFYIYENTISLSKATQANNSYELSNLDDDVRKTAGVEAGDVSYYTLNGTTLQKVSTIALTEGTTKDYYVKVGEKYYNVSVAFTIS